VRKRCVFCGEMGSSREHVFARWISRQLVHSGGAPFTLTTTSGRSKAGLPTVSVVTRDVCEPCNHGWMAKIEETAKPLLSGTIRGEAATWDATEQLAVATWAFKTAMMLDRSNEAAREVPPEHFDYMWRRRQPPPTVQISVARYHPRVGEEHHGVVAAVRAGDPSIKGSYSIVLSVGQIVFTLHGRAGLDPRGVRVDVAVVSGSGLWVPLWDTFVRVWPASGDVLEWPPRDGVLLSSENLRLLMDEPLTVGRAFI
jgi:hypothetical protein